MRLEDIMVRDGIISADKKEARKTDGDKAHYIVRLARDIKFLSLAADGIDKGDCALLGEFAYQRKRFAHLVNNKGACRAKIRSIVRVIQRKLDWLKENGIISPKFRIADVVERGRARDTMGWGEIVVDDYAVAYIRNHLTKIEEVVA